VLPGVCHIDGGWRATFHKIKTKPDLTVFKLLERSKNELLPFSEAPQAPALHPGEGLSTPAAGPDTYIGPTSSMHSVCCFVLLTRYWGNDMVPGSFLESGDLGWADPHPPP